jgi:hypothetical protein
LLFSHSTFLGISARQLWGFLLGNFVLFYFTINKAFLTKLNTYYQNTLDAHNAQLSFKARMMEKAKEAKTFLTQVQALYSEARKQVKMTLAKETWREFGIVDQR